MRILKTLSVLVLSLSVLGCQTTDKYVQKKAADDKEIAFDMKKSVYDMPDISPGARPPANTMEGSLWMQVDKAEGQIRTSGNLIRDKELNAYIHGIVCKLAGPYCPDIKTYIVRMPDFNASMMPNGVMQIWTGLLLRVRNEAQLATVLGHELGHYMRRHSLKRMKGVIDSTNALVFLQLATAAAGVPTAGDLMTLATVGSIQAYSRDNERESDDFGIRLLIRHGYDPRAAKQVWEQMIEEREAIKGASGQSYFYATHPPSEERSATLGGMAKYALKTLSRLDTHRDRYLSFIGPYRKSFLTDEIRMRRFDRFEALIDMLIKDGESLGLLKFFKGELHRLRDDEDEKDRTKAIELYRAAILLPGAPPETYRSLGRTLMKQKKSQEAKDAYRKYLELAPLADDRKMIMYLLEGGS